MNLQQILAIPKEKLHKASKVKVNILPDVESLYQHFARSIADEIKQLDFGKEMDATNMEVVVGEEEKGVLRSITWHNSVKSMQKIADYAEKIGLRTAVELEPFKSSLVYGINTMLKYLNAVNSEYCRANLDIGHCHIMRITPQAIKRLGERTVHVHISG